MLNERERDALEEIEHGLSRADPRLHRIMQTTVWDQRVNWAVAWTVMALWLLCTALAAIDGPWQNTVVPSVIAIGALVVMYRRRPRRPPRAALSRRRD